ncbi:MAG TPA: hypothetical protein VHY75_15760 [Steroidobacteraceae bacterium]|jgi:hypothetical protein|nr:hypothetical protein [Steroidobacteraceae bacterium]
MSKLIVRNFAVAALAVLCGCHPKTPPVATPADVASAQEEARKEVEQARVEARKDVKSAAKVSGGDAKNVAHARATGAFDIAMAQAEGDHKIALTRCKTLEPGAQPPCTAEADAQFQAAIAKAKAARVGGESQP